MRIQIYGIKLGITLYLSNKKKGGIKITFKQKKEI